MIELFTIYLPFATCLLMVLLFVVLPYKSVAQKLTIPILIIAGVSFLGDACFFDQSISPATLIVMDAASQFLSPCIGPLVIMFVLALYRTKVWQWNLLLWVVFPVFLGVTSLLLYLLIGIDDAIVIKQCIRQQIALPARLETPVCEAHMFVERVLFYLLMSFQMLFLIVYLGVRLLKSRFSFASFGGFMFKNGELDIRQVVMFLMQLLLIVVFARCAFAQEYYSITALGVIVSLLSVALTLCLCSFIVMSNAGVITLEELKAKVVNLLGFAHTPDANAVVPTDARADAGAEALAVPHEPQADMVQSVYARIRLDLPTRPDPANASHVNMSPADYARAFRALNKLLLANKAYLDTQVSLASLAAKMKLNKSYLSSMVNKEYGMPFRDLIGRLRIDYALQYMADHPYSRQEEIAAQCGFTSIITFNRKFTQLTGLTPNSWRKATRYADNDANKTKV